MDARAGQVLQFWFTDALQSAPAAQARAKVWFRFDPSFDDAILEHFGGLPDEALSGLLNHWMLDARSALARVLVLDQFPRNLYRNDARAYAYDGEAVTGSLAALESGFDVELHPLEAVFLYLPFEHAESMELQNVSVAKFDALRQRAPLGWESQFDGFLDYARRHRAVIERFGRFPHRNVLLGRIPTAQEVEYLEGGGEIFGPKER